MPGFKLWRLGLCSCHFSLLLPCMYAVRHMIHMVSHINYFCFNASQTCSCLAKVFQTGFSFYPTELSPSWFRAKATTHRLLVTSGWQYCHTEPLGCSKGLASSLKMERPHHLRSFQAAPQMQFLHCPQSTQDSSVGGESDLK